MKDKVIAEFVNIKNIPTRNSMQLIFELPVENAKNALDILGYPDNFGSKYCEIVVMGEGDQ